MDLTRRLMNTVITTYGRDVATANTEFQRLGGTIPGGKAMCGCAPTKVGGLPPPM